MTIQAQERETYRDMFAIESYGDFSPGERYAPVFASLATPGATVLDAGCGTGKGLLALEALGYDVFGCDLTADGLLPETKHLRMVEACLWRDLSAVTFLAGVEQFDYVYCCDVLEHIPTPFTMLVVRNLLSVAKHGVFLSIALQPDQCGVWIGKHLHRTVQSFSEWRDQLKELGTVTEARDLMTTGIYMVTAR